MIAWNRYERRLEAQLLLHAPNFDQSVGDFLEVALGPTLRKIAAENHQVPRPSLGVHPLQIIKENGLERRPHPFEAGHARMQVAQVQPTKILTHRGLGSDLGNRLSGL